MSHDAPLTLGYMCVLQELKERVMKGKYRIPYYMSTDCESLVKKFLVVSPAKRTTLEVDMCHFCVVLTLASVFAPVDFYKDLLCVKIVYVPCLQLMLLLIE